MLGKTVFIRLLFCISLFVFRIESVSAFSTFDQENPYQGFDNLQLDSAIQSTSLKYQKHPANALIITQLAELYDAKEETDSAVAYWKKLTVIQPQNDTAYYRQALLLYDDEKYDSTYTAIQQSLSIRRDNINYLSLAATTAYQLHKEDTALTLCKKVLAQDAQNVNALLLSGIIYRDQKNYDDALIQFNHCLTADPANTDALLHRAEILVLVKQYNNALRDYSAARADLSENADIVNNIGICYYQSGSYQKAITFFKKALYINSRHPQSSFNEGITHYKLNDFDSAALDMKTASILWDSCQTDTCKANFLDAIYYLGMCYKKTGDLPAAKSNFELLQKQGYAKDLTSEIRNIDYSLFISRNWYYIAAAFVLLLSLLIIIIRGAKKR